MVNYLFILLYFFRKVNKKTLKKVLQMKMSEWTDTIFINCFRRKAKRGLGTSPKTAHKATTAHRPRTYKPRCFSCPSTRLGVLHTPLRLSSV